MKKKVKQVWVENHQEVIQAWSEYRKTKDRPPHLVSFDSHTDVYPPFEKIARQLVDPNMSISDIDTPGTRKKIKARQDELLQGASCENKESIFSAIQKLNSDEHIKFALHFGLIDNVYIFLSTEKSNSYDDAPIHVFGDICLPECPYKIHKAQCRRKLADHLLENDFLTLRLQRIEQSLSCGIFETDYILDIDLDFFVTEKSISPNDPRAFYELIRNAGLITVAREPEWTEKCSLDKDFSVEDRASILKEHIENAFSES